MTPIIAIIAVIAFWAFVINWLLKGEGDGEHNDHLYN